MSGASPLPHGAPSALQNLQWLVAKLTWLSRHFPPTVRQGHGLQKMKKRRNKGEKGTTVYIRQRPDRIRKERNCCPQRNAPKSANLYCPSEKILSLSTDSQQSAKKASFLKRNLLLIQHCDNCEKPPYRLHFSGGKFLFPMLRPLTVHFLEHWLCTLV